MGLAFETENCNSGPCKGDEISLFHYLDYYLLLGERKAQVRPKLIDSFREKTLFSLREFQLQGKSYIYQITSVSFNIMYEE